ncbi:MAG: lysophospholipase [Flavobacteriaceae bacterium]|nr:lysophospholipase [Flavobacteriaceae bacterium]
MKIYSYLLSLMLFAFVSCKQKKAETPQGAQTLTYLALGDSYTIGESVTELGRWPHQLAKVLEPIIKQSLLTTIVAKTGWTTNELNQGINEASLETNYDLISLLIGVNNQYRGRSIEEYKLEFESLLKRAVAFKRNDNSPVFVVSIPDYGVTPFVQNSNRDPIQIASEIDLFNKAAEQICAQYGIPFYNITGISRTAANDPNLIAEDGLHPSAQMYRLWVDYFHAAIADKLLANETP